mgnify:CR=1 FL=1
MKISEQPGRMFAIFIFGPYLIYKGNVFNDDLLVFMGIIFILYELFWVINYDPKIVITSLKGQLEHTESTGSSADVSVV